jgi:hypothetical protein
MHILYTEAHTVTLLIYLLTTLDYVITCYIKQKSVNIFSISDIYQHTKIQVITTNGIIVAPISEVCMLIELVLLIVRNWKYKVVMASNKVILIQSFMKISKFAIHKRHTDQHEHDLNLSHLSLLTKQRSGIRRQHPCSYLCWSQHKCVTKQLHSLFHFTIKCQCIFSLSLFSLKNTFTHN